MPPGRAGRASTSRQQAPQRSILDLSSDELGLVLKFLPRAENIARAASVSRGFKLAAQHATAARAAASAAAVNGILASSTNPLNPLSNKLRAVRWAEAVPEPRTLTAGDTASACIVAGSLWAWGGDNVDPGTDDFMSVVGLGPRDERVLSPELAQLSMPGAACTEPEPVARAVSSDCGGGMAVDTCGRVWIWGEPLVDLSRAVTVDSGHDPIHFGRPERIKTHYTGGLSILQASVGENHCLLLTVWGTVLAFGVDEHGQLGIGVDGRNSRKEPTEVTSFADRRVVEVSAGGCYSAAVDECGGLWTWGDGAHGKLGHGDCMHRVEPTQVLALLPPKTREEVMAMSVKEIKKELARRHEPFEERSKAKLAERLLAAQPKRGFRVSADGTCIRQDTRIRHVSAGGDHTLAVTFTGEVYGWGSDLDDQLGLGGRDVGVNDSQWWPQLIGAPKPYGENEDMLPVRQVSAGKHHSVILTESGEVFAMGSNEFGQLGIESPTALPEDAIEGMPIPASVEPFNVWTAPYLNAFTVKDLKVKLERRGESTVGVKAVLVARLLAAQPEHDPVVEVAAGYMHTLARTASGRVYSWGNGEEGRLGHDDEDDRVEPMEVGFPDPQGGPVSGSDLV